MGRFLVIGGSSGIGLSLAEQLLSAGHEVVTLSRRAAPIEQATTLQCDLSSDPLPKLEEGFDGLAYCPGSITLKPFPQLTLEDFQKDFEVNCLGAVKAIQAYLPLLEKRPISSIVLFSTVAVQRGMGFHASIATAKGGVEALTRSLAAELAPKVRVNCIAPSLTQTPLAEPLMRHKETIEKRHPLARLGEAKDCAALAKFLLTNEASWITGQVIGVDGGLSTLSTF